jgi:hypothetical protein
MLVLLTLTFFIFFLNLNIACKITEIFFDPIGNDNNKEFIELNCDLNLSSCLLCDSSSCDNLTKIKENNSNNITLITEIDSIYNYKNITIYSAGSTLGNNLNNDKDNITIKCKNKTINQNYNIDLFNSFISGYSIIFFNKTPYLNNKSTPGHLDNISKFIKKNNLTKNKTKLNNNTFKTNFHINLFVKKSENKIFFNFTFNKSICNKNCKIKYIIVELLENKIIRNYSTINFNKKSFTYKTDSLKCYKIFAILYKNNQSINNTKFFCNNKKTSKTNNKCESNFEIDQYSLHNNILSYTLHLKKCNENFKNIFLYLYENKSKNKIKSIMLEKYSEIKINDRINICNNKGNKLILKTSSKEYDSITFKNNCNYNKKQKTKNNISNNKIKILNCTIKKNQTKIYFNTNNTKAGNISIYNINTNRRFTTKKEKIICKDEYCILNNSITISKINFTTKNYYIKINNKKYNNINCKKLKINNLENNNTLIKNKTYKQNNKITGNTISNFNISSIENIEDKKNKHHKIIINSLFTLTLIITVLVTLLKK